MTSADGSRVFVSGLPSLPRTGGVSHFGGGLAGDLCTFPGHVAKDQVVIVRHWPPGFPSTAPTESIDAGGPGRAVLGARSEIVPQIPLGDL